MTRKMCVVCLVLGLVMPALMQAEQHEEASPAYAYGTYFECDPEREWLADAIVAQVFKPAYDEAVEEGTISGWGYLAHHTGGNWRRVIYRIAPTLDASMAALDKIAEKVQASNAAAAAEFGSICNSHDDYLWRAVVGSSGTAIAENRGEVGFSVYFNCNEASESRADDAVKEHFAPVYDAQVEAGNLVSWGYMEHWVGGEYRRLLTLTATDLGKLMTGRDNAVNALMGMEDAIGAFFNSCTSHSDYIWNIQHETP